MKKKYGCLLLIVLLLTAWTCAGAGPNLTLQDKTAYSGSWAEAYEQILSERAAGIEAYQNYVISTTYIPFCRAVGLMDLTADGSPELLFWELITEPEYGFQVGRFSIYTCDWTGVHCALTLQPEIDDMLYSRYYLAKDGLLTIDFNDCEMDWIMQLRPDIGGRYRAENTLISAMDFSGEGPDEYFQNEKKITEKKYKSLVSQVRKDQGNMIGSLQVDENGYGFTHTLEEALEALASGKAAAQWPEAGNAAGQGASPSGGLLPGLTFFRGTFPAGQKYDVYSAPSAKSWRAANGKASITSGSEIFVAGKADGWVLILYELGSGVIRAGYIDPNKISGTYTAGGDLSFSGISMTLTKNTVMTDDPFRQKETVGKLKKGTSVLCLAEFRGMIYIEAKVNGKTARGFIAPSALGMNGTGAGK